MDYLLIHLQLNLVQYNLHQLKYIAHFRIEKTIRKAQF